MRVAVEELGIDVPVVPVGVDGGGAMDLPNDARTAGWYRHGPGPTSAAGTTVVAAHVDDEAGAGPFARLRSLAAGAEVVVTDADGTRHAYAVTEVRSVPKPEVPLDDVFDRTGGPRLVLVTCGGAWDGERRSYSDNVLVTARRADAP
ncbi:class F sortase [Puerhibacterium sp. TATVAM-FAB25]|uniref:class F sortase n=1 Tax=Puerhibacterium sp. TATVAM-FAB25 TaxID=3093699 RepID=UPI00397B4E03